MAKEIPTKLNVLLVGGGGREHALAWKMRQSDRLGTLFITHTSNPGLTALGSPVDAPVTPRDPFRLQRFCDNNDIHLVVIGPEDPLAEGLADALRTKDRAVFGPGADGARLEADKAWAKQLMRSASIPTAEARIFTDPIAAKRHLVRRSRRAHTSSMTPSFYRRDDASPAVADDRFLDDLENRVLNEGGPSEWARANRDAFETAHLHAISTLTIDLVIKASGLARGKGVIVPETLGEALDAVDRIMVQREFGEAGASVVLEERLQGPEASVLALVDGRTIYVLEACQDHKRLLDGGAGPNTGGMGAYSPAPVVDDAMMRLVQKEILVPIVDALRRDGIDYRGVIYAGLMLTHAGPKVLEFNVRFGDPECQPLMARLRGDLVEMLWRTATGSLSEVSFDWDPRAACCVVMASRGYPDTPETGFPITGIDDAEALGDVKVFHAGTARAKDGSIVTAGGRVLGVTAMGDDIEQARTLANRACDMIHFEGAQRRTDIGAGAMTPAGS